MMIKVKKITGAAIILALSVSAGSVFAQSGAPTAAQEIAGQLGMLTIEVANFREQIGILNTQNAALKKRIEELEGKYEPKKAEPTK
jgi:ubiquinone biosynthesis protein UbiJ